MPAALLVMQRKVPIRLIWMMRSKLSSGYSLISWVCRSRETVFTEPPTPAQFTRMRSWPIAARDLANAASISGVEVTFALQNTPPISLASFSPRSSFRSKRPTLTPCDARRRAVAAPRPEAPPVITAEIVESSFIRRFLPMFFCFLA